MRQSSLKDELLAKLATIEFKSQQQIEDLSTLSLLENYRRQYLGKKGEIATISKKLGQLDQENRKLVGEKLNQLKSLLGSNIQRRRKKILTGKGKLYRGWFDPTIPGKTPQYGRLHPLTKIIEEVYQIFHYLGFSLVYGPEVELDEINFQKLRLDPNHPSRDTQETYYLGDEVLLRVHTSSVQIRYMQSHQPPIRIFSPGRVYRRDRIDSTHLPSFYQIEGLLVDKQARLTDLLGTLTFFVKRLFGEDRKVRFYGHNFPYTEPSLEVAVEDKKTRWLEILGCGMVHPEVLANCGIDPKIFRGWAFGMGADRLAMLKYGIEDIRLLYSGDLRFLNP